MDAIEALVKEAKTKALRVGAFIDELPEYADMVIYPVDEAEVEFEKYATRNAGQDLLFGYPKLDDISNGVMPGHICLLAARPGIGKTNFILNVIRKQTKRVLFFSLEMTVYEIVARGIQISTSIHQKFLPEIIKTNPDRYADILVRYNQNFAHMLVADKSGLTPKNIHFLTQLAERQFGDISAIFIDYFNLLRCEGRFTGPYDHASQVARALQEVAKELNKPILCACQLNRQGSDYTKPPRLEHLRESGVLEEVTALVLGIHRPDDEKAVITVLKNKRGPLGSVDMKFDWKTLKIEEA
jgi:replicative DNA helicase